VETDGVEFEPARGRIERIGLGVLVKVNEAGRISLPVIGCGNDEIALFPEFLIGHHVLTARAVEPVVDELLVIHIARIFLVKSQLFCDLGNRLVAAFAFSDGLYALPS